MTSVVPDTLCVFIDDAGVEYRFSVPRLGHTDREVRAVAYRWICKQIADGKAQPYGEVTFVRLGSNL